jgi:hypothetical protein
VSTVLFTRYGWRVAAGFALGLMGIELLVLVVRGPHCRRKTWFGYEDARGGDAPDVEKAPEASASDAASVSTLGVPELRRQKSGDHPPQHKTPTTDTNT